MPTCRTVIRPVIAITASTAAAPRTKAPATAPDSAAGLTLIGGRSIQRVFLSSFRHGLDLNRTFWHIALFYSQLGFMNRSYSGVRNL